MKKILTVFLFLSIIVANILSAVNVTLTETEFAKLKASDYAQSDAFGWAVSISGDYAIVSSRYDDDHGSSSGSAYIFHRENDNWVQQAKLTASDAASTDYFGQAVSISGDYAVVGAYGDDDVYSSSGSAYVFKRNGTSWNQVAKLNGDPFSGGDFGYAVAVDSDRIIVGARDETGLATNSGTAYVFKRTNETWNREAKLFSPHSADHDDFGFAVAIHGNTIVIGAKYYDLNGSSASGAAYIYEYENSAWTETDTLLANNSGVGHQFGYSVAVYQDRIAIGARYYDSPTASNGGAVYVYEKNGNNWTNTDQLIPADIASSDNFGYSVSIFENYIVSGSRADDDLGSSTGSAYLYTYENGDWSETKKFFASDANGEDGSDYFGHSIFINDYRVICGSYAEDTGASNSGGAYIYELTVPVQAPNTATCVFPENYSAGMPKRVTVDWEYSQTTGGEATGFKIYKGDTEVADIAYTTDKIYTHVFTGLRWGETVYWKVVPYNNGGACTEASAWNFTVRENPGSQSGENDTPNEIVYMRNKNFSGTAPDPLVLPAIDFGTGNVQPQVGFNFGSAVSNFNLEVRAQDQPDNPVPLPQNVRASFTTNLPSNIPTTLTLNVGSGFTPYDLWHWTGTEWEDISHLGTFSEGSVIFTYTSSARADEEFVINNGDGSLPVILSTFNAVQTQNRSVVLEWSTRSESEMNGFYVYRNTDSDFVTAEKVNANIIASINNPDGASYTFNDNDVDLNAKYSYWLESLSLNGRAQLYGPVEITLQGDKEDDLPEYTNLGIQSIYPNPFNPLTNIFYSVKENTHVLVEVFNLKGQKVKTLVDAEKNAGDHSIRWYGDSNSGASAASGIYFVKMKTDYHQEIQKIMMIK